jgi:hypothetical protein
MDGSTRLAVADFSSMSKSLNGQQVAACKSLEGAFQKCVEANLQLYVTSRDGVLTLKAVDRDAMCEMAVTEEAALDALEYEMLPLQHIEHFGAVGDIVLFDGIMLFDGESQAL